MLGEKVLYDFICEGLVAQNVILVRVLIDKGLDVPLLRDYLLLNQVVTLETELFQLSHCLVRVSTDVSGLRLRAQRDENPLTLARC